MIKTLLQHEILSFKRAAAFRKKLGIRIAMFFLLGYLFLNVLAIGFFAKTLILSSYPGVNPVDIYNSYILYFLISDLLMRMILQSTPALKMNSYLHLAIKKSDLSMFILIRSLISFFNFYPILIVAPFAINGVAPYYDSTTALTWFLAIYSLVFMNNFLAVYLKKISANNSSISTLLFISLILIIGLQNLGVINLSELSTQVFSLILQDKLNFLIVLALPVLTFILNYNSFKANTYIEEITSKKQSTVKDNKALGFLSRFGDIGELIILEFKMILRNKRPRGAMSFLVVAPFYGLFFIYTSRGEEINFMHLFAGVFMTGMPMIAYGNLLFSWNSGYFSKLMTSNFSIRNYIYSKYYLMLLTSSLMMITLFAYAFHSWELVYIYFIAYIFNIGFSSIYMIRIGLVKPERIDLSQKATFNFQGVGGHQFVSSLPIFFAPIILSIIMFATGNDYLTKYIIAAVGLIMLALHKYLLDAIINSFIKKKYQIMESFRAS